MRNKHVPTPTKPSTSKLSLLETASAGLPEIVPGRRTYSHSNPESSQDQSPPLKPKRTNPNATSRLMRADYHRQPVLTYAEAASIAGVKVTTIEKWVCLGRLSTVRNVGPFRIARETLDKLLSFGKRTKEPRTKVTIR